jgi:tryptophan-rich sensory protein
MELLDTYVKGVRKVATMVVKSNERSGFQSGSTLASTIVSVSQNTSTKMQELPDESFLTALVIFFLVWQIIFALGGAVQSYMYNQSIGTQPFLAFVYILLSFLFPYFYYPYYTFFLSGREGGNGNNRQNNGMMGGSKK